MRRWGEEEEVDDGGVELGVISLRVAVSLLAPTTLLVHLSPHPPVRLDGSAELPHRGPANVDFPTPPVRDNRSGNLLSSPLRSFYGKLLGIPRFLSC